MQCKKDILRMIMPLLAVILLNPGCDRPRESKSEQADSLRKESADSTELKHSRELIRARTMGLAYLEDNQLEEAEKAFKTMIDLAPEEALGYANLGIVYMRMGKYDEAEKQLKIAVELDPDDPDIRHNLARVYDLSDKKEASREELEKTIEMAPDHVQSLYSLAETYQNKADENSLKQWESYLTKITESTPANLVVRLYLSEALIRNGETEKAIKNLEEIGKISPAFPDEAQAYYEKAIDELNNGNTTGALTSIRIFHNLLKLTNQYQTDIQQLKGSSASRIGTPVISFSNTTPVFLMEGESLLDALIFTEVTQSSDLSVVHVQSEEKIKHKLPLAVADMDRDGDQDLYISQYDPTAGIFRPVLLQNDMGRFRNIATKAGIRYTGKENTAVFTDYDNDGFLDIYIAGEEENRLYSNIDEGVFQDVTNKTGTAGRGKTNNVLFFDMDQDGDLDLFVGNASSINAYQNNGDGTFTDQSVALSFCNNNMGTRDAGFTDIDDDGDVDLIILRSDGSLKIYKNDRESRFSEVTEVWGIESVDRGGSLSIGDYNNDGFSDLFIGSETGEHLFYTNQAGERYMKSPNFEEFPSSFKELAVHDAEFFDFDNDGFLDLIAGGTPTIESGKSIYLLHNTGSSRFADVSHLLPENNQNIYTIETADYNEDGDLDIYLIDESGSIRLFRNDGGNAHHHLKIQLVGLRTGSGKNNYYGIGAKVEVRAGELYQMKTVTKPVVHFGLGNREKVDVVRILWTNGVPQNIFSPGSDQDLIEEQELKGSCPFLYTWNGSDYDFQKDMMWRSALGMPLGIMGESTSYAFANASKEYLKIPGENLKPRNNRYSLQITSELWETIYFDNVQLIAVDHPNEVDIYVDEKFIPPPFPDMKIWVVGKKKPPVSVKNEKDREMLPLITEKDHKYITGFTKSPYQGLVNTHDLIIDLGDSLEEKNAILFLNGWIFPTDASINVALSQTKKLSVIQPYLQVINEQGDWETVISNMGFPMGKNKTVVVDLRNRFKSDDHRIRIRTNMEIYWDHLFYTDCNQDDFRIPYKIATPSSANLHYRGFSQMYRKGGINGPHWFEYSVTSTKPKWRDLKGNYTRYGDVRELLETSDNLYVIMNAGDEVTLEFAENAFPDLPDGWTRDFLIYSVGWVKDGDLNTAFGDQVEPLPYHGMTSYPYSVESSYFKSKEFNDYLRRYNTRKVTNREFRNEIREFDD